MDVDPSNDAKGGPPTQYGGEYQPLAQEEPQELFKPPPPENTAWTDNPQPNAPLLQDVQPYPSYGSQASPEVPGYGYQQQGDGYQQQGYGYQPAPVPYQPTPIAYQPAPSAVHNVNTNVVVVSQPPVAQPQVVVHHRNEANDCMVPSILLLVICFLCGNWFLFICLIPALIFSILASNANSARDYDRAKAYGNASIGCNVTAVVVFGLLVIAAVIIVTLIIVKGLDFIAHNDASADN